MAKINSADIGLEQKIWNAACVLRGKINTISVYGPDSNPTTWKMAQMNLANGFLSSQSGGEGDIRRQLKSVGFKV